VSSDAARHFAGYAGEYRRFRPGYPDVLFERLVELAPRPGRVWECGAGSGQATGGLATRFGEVIATDVARRQLERAPETPRVRRVVCAAERAPLRGASVDLVVVAQALHWFDAEAFAAEVRRVGRPDAILAVWAYGLPTVCVAIDRVLMRLHDDVLDACWRPERRHVVSSYETLPVPLPALVVESYALEKRWTLERFLGYVGTWSAVREYAERHGGADAVAIVRDDLAGAWPGGAEAEARVRWPLTLRAYTVAAGPRRRRPVEGVSAGR